VIPLLARMLRSFVAIWVVLLVVGLLLLGLTEAAQVTHAPAQVAIEQREREERQTQEYEESQRQAQYEHSHPGWRWEP
jgi:hypothetical protein